MQFHIKSISYLLRKFFSSVFSSYTSVVWFVGGVFRIRWNLSIMNDFKYMNIIFFCFVILFWIFIIILNLRKSQYQPCRYTCVALVYIWIICSLMNCKEQSDMDFILLWKCRSDCTSKLHFFFKRTGCIIFANEKYCYL